MDLSVLPALLGDLSDIPQLWGILVALGLPGLTAVIQRPHFPKWLRVTIMVVVSIIGGTVAVYASGELDLTNWITTVIAVILATQTAYKTLWKVKDAAAVIEWATTPKSLYFDPEVEFELLDFDPDDYECGDPLCCPNGCVRDSE